MHWKTHWSHIKKAKQSKYRFIIIVFFDIKGVIRENYVPGGGNTMTKHRRTDKKVRRKKPQLWGKVIRAALQHTQHSQ